jgi:hypothetical protein
LAARPSLSKVAELSVELVLNSSRACLSNSVEFSISAIICVDKYSSTLIFMVRKNVRY